MASRRGATLIDLLISLGILALLFGGIYLVYFSLIDSSANIEYRSEAAALLAEQVEIIRNLPYDKVGTQSGIPVGILLQQKQVSIGSHSYVLTTTVRNIDDPLDGQIGKTPNDTSPADYKLVSLEIDCPTCTKFKPLAFTTTIAPKSLEGSSNSGSLFVNVFDAAGQPISEADIRIVNASVTPSIDLTDITNQLGILQLVGVPTSTQSYQVSVTKSGYSSDKTYLIGATSNPDPLKPHATVAAQTVTNLSFAIDRTGLLEVQTLDRQCAETPNENFSVAGAKLVGNPDVLKFTTSTQTNSSGLKQFTNMEWDTYSMTYQGSGILAGTIPFSPMTLNPGVDANFKFIVAPSSPRSLLVSTQDETGSPITGAEILLSKSGFSETKNSGQFTIGHTDWSVGEYTTKDDEVETDLNPGVVELKANASGTYSTGSGHSFISKTFNLGSNSVSLVSFEFNSVRPTGTDIKFRLAGNNDNATWDFVGPDGTAGTYYTSQIFTPHTSLNGKRYLRYEATLSTSDETLTPTLNTAEISWSGGCVPPGQALFGGLEIGSYDLNISASGYQPATGTVSVGSNWQQVSLSLTQ